MKLTKQQKWIASSGATVALGLFLGAWALGPSSESTDNAYTAAHVATLSSKVAGLVTEVLVEENEEVKKDQILARIDPRDYQNALDNLRAEVAQVDVTLELARKNQHRSTRLFAERAVTEQERDDDRSKVGELQKKHDALTAQIAQAQLNLSFAEVRAPAAGRIGRKAVEPGMVVAVGQPLLSFVDARPPWLVANFKETQLRRMHVGQKVHVEIDSIGSQVFEGEIESFSPGTGATFSLIPPDNATGNFTKIVQRLPVRIKFAAASIHGFEDRIVPGLSAEARVFLK